MLQKIRQNNLILLLFAALASIYITITASYGDWPKFFEKGKGLEKGVAKVEPPRITDSQDLAGWYRAWEVLSSDDHTPSESLVAAYNFILANPPAPDNRTFYTTHQYRVNMDYLVRYLAANHARERYESFPIYQLRDMRQNGNGNGK